MRKHKILLVAGALLVAACGGEAVDETTTTSADTTTTVPASTTTAAPTTTTSTTTTTEAAPEAQGDLAKLHAAMANSAEIIPSRVEGVIKLTGLPAEAGVSEVEMPISVMIDPESGDTAMAMDFGAMAGAMADSEDVPAELAELMGSMEVRQIGDTVYLKFPFFTAFLGAETEWVSMPAEEGADVTQDMSDFAPSDPTEFLRSFAEAEGKVEEIGTEEIRGYQTTHYRVIIDKEWKEALSAEQLAELEAQGPLPDAEFPLDLWIDDDGLVHRLSMEADASQFEEEPEEAFGTMTMTFDFMDFGQPVVIEPPPADQVTDIEDLEGGFFGDLEG